MQPRELYSVLCGNLNGKKIKNRGDTLTCVRMADSEFAVQQKPTQHCKAAILQKIH